MTDKNDISELEDIQRRINAARETGSHRPKGDVTRGTAGLGFKLGVDFLSGVIVGAAVGRFADVTLSTEPLFLVVFLFIGGAAGMLNVYRGVKQVEEDRKNATRE